MTYDELVEIHAETLFTLCGGAWGELFKEEQEHGLELSRAALAAIREAGLAIVPRKPTKDMLEEAGPMEGWAEYAHPNDADRCHEEWYEAAVAAGEIKPEGGE